LALGVLLLALVVVAAACKQVPTQGAAPASSGACRALQPASAGPITITSGGIARTYLLSMPSPPPATPARLIVDLHGAGSDAQQQAVYSDLAVEGPARGFVVATPDATGQPKQWNIVGQTKADDVTFINDLLTDVARRACVDETHVYATGLSSGAAMSSKLACKDGARFTAIAPVSGVVFLPSECKEGPPVSVIAFHGTNDFVLPFDGGSVFGGAGLSYPGALQGMDGWVTRGGCAATPEKTPVSPHVTLERWPRCASGATVEIYVIDGGGHTWPGAAIQVSLLGVTTDEINATDIILDAFSR
jgi:polyhydroxybutyrate depolymerase